MSCQGRHVEGFVVQLSTINFFIQDKGYVH